MSDYKWKFVKIGKLTQVCLDKGDDLIHLDELDPKLWSAMMCPLTNMEFDAKTLEYIDTDGDKRIKLPEILAAVKWVCYVLKNPNDLINPQEELPLSVIDSSKPEGKKLVSAIQQILKNLNKENDPAIGLNELADTQKIFAATAFNGDGIIPADAAADAQTGIDKETASAIAKFIEQAIACEGSETDRSGKAGISKALLDKFLTDCKDYSAWIKASKNEKVMFAGDNTTAMAGVYSSVKGKIDDFFIRCRLISFDKVYETAGQELKSEYAALLKKSLSGSNEELREMPVALSSVEAILPLYEKTNPTWASELVNFAEEVVKPVIGETKTLDETQWNTIKNKFAPYEAWIASKKGSAVEGLGEARVDEILACGLDAKIVSLINNDKALESEFNEITTIDKLIRYYKYLYILLNNYTCFGDFYNPEKKAIFQAGTLYMDGRSCELCVKIDDIGSHSAASAASNIFLAYCVCVKKGTGETMNIVAGFTDGDSDDLTVGRNGIFIDRKGGHWDATINKIVDHPISIRQAFWSPYKRLGKMINEQIEKFASSKDKAVTDSLATSVNTTSQKVTETKKEGETAQATNTAVDIGKYAGIFAAIGLAIGAIGSAIGGIFTGCAELWKQGWYMLPLAILGIMLVISGPSMIIAWLRLRKRSLGAVLNANGWAVNTKAQISVPMGRKMTDLATLPEGSKVELRHPYGIENHKVAKWIIGIIIVALLGWAVYAYCPFCCKAKTADANVQTENLASGTVDVNASATASETVAAPVAK